jgi:hypothetical protein
MWLRDGVDVDALMIREGDQVRASGAPYRDFGLIDAV